MGSRGGVSFRPRAVGAREALARFICAMIIPCLVVVYLLIRQWTLPEFAAHYELLRARWPEFAAPLRFLSDWGNVIFYPVYAGMLAWGIVRKRPDLARFAWVYLVVQLLISFALVRLLKITLGCPRPDAEGLFGLCLPFSLDAGHNAVPSGHTAEVVGAALPLVMCLKPLWPALLAGGFIAIMAYSRVFLGWHSPVDLAFGLAFGGYAAWLIYIYGRKA